MKDVIDPLATSERITETYHRYLTSLLSLRDSRLAAGLSDKIRTSGSMTRGPYLDVTPPYEKGASIKDLVDQGILSHELLDICSGALPADRPLYVHWRPPTPRQPVSRWSRARRRSIRSCLRPVRCTRSAGGMATRRTTTHSPRARSARWTTSTPA